MERSEIERQVSGLSLMLEFFPEVKGRIVAAFMQAGAAEPVGAGTILLGEGESDSQRGYLLLSGEVEIRKANGFTVAGKAPMLLGEMKQFHFDAAAGRSASVVATGGLEVLRFDWPTLYAALGERLSPDELGEFRTALERYAWMHFLEQEEEL